MCTRKFSEGKTTKTVCKWLKVLEECLIMDPREGDSMKNHEKSFLHRVVLVEQVHVWIQTIHNTLRIMKEGNFSLFAHLMIILKVLTLRR